MNLLNLFSEHQIKILIKHSCDTQAITIRIWSIFLYFKLKILITFCSEIRLRYFFCFPYFMELYSIMSLYFEVKSLKHRLSFVICLFQLRLTVIWPPSDHLLTIVWVSFDLCFSIFWSSFEHRLTSVFASFWVLFDHRLTIIWTLFHLCFSIILTSVWALFEYGLASILASFKQRFSIVLSSIWPPFDLRSNILWPSFYVSLFLQ